MAYSVWILLWHSTTNSTREISCIDLASLKHWYYLQRLSDSRRRVSRLRQRLIYPRMTGRNPLDSDSASRPLLWLW
jgi:hypothetical protein